MRALQALDRVAMATATGVNQEEKMAPCSPRQFATCDEVTYSVCIEGLPHGTSDAKLVDGLKAAQQVRARHVQAARCSVG